MTTTRNRDGIVIVLSVALHGALFFGLRMPAGPGARHRPPTTVTLDVRAAPAPLPAAAAPVPAPTHATERRRVVARPARPLPAPTASAAPSPAAEAPVDLTGVTLTDGSGSAWASAVGNGAPMTGPLAAPRAGRSASNARPSGGSGESPPALVALTNLGHPPEPPALEAALEREYPPDARREGVSGQAVVAARVRPDGGVDQIRLLEVTAPAFGDSCRRILAASHWSPPLDRDGRPCATVVRYTCRFEVNR